MHWFVLLDVCCEFLWSSALTRGQCLCLSALLNIMCFNRNDFFSRKCVAFMCQLCQVCHSIHTQSLFDVQFTLCCENQTKVPSLFNPLAILMHFPYVIISIDRHGMFDLELHCPGRTHTQWSTQYCPLQDLSEFM